MKSLRKFIKEAAGMHNFFHATSIDNISSILSKGLVPGFQKPAGQDWLGDHHGHGIYLHSSFPEHELENGYYDDEGPSSVVFEVQLPFDKSKFLPDEEIGYDISPEGAAKAFHEGLAVAYMGTIKPSSIVAIYIPVKWDDNSEEVLEPYNQALYKFMDKGGMVYRWDVESGKVIE